MLRGRQWIVIAVAVTALCAWRGVATVHAQTPQGTPTVSATPVVTETWRPYTDSGSAFILEYAPRWTAAPRQTPGTAAFTEGETKSIMLAVFPRAGRDLDALLRTLLKPPEGFGGAGMQEEVTTSGLWLHLTPGKFGRVSLINMDGEAGERLVVLGTLNEETLVLGLLGNVPGIVTPGDEADLARLIDSIRLLGPGSSVTPVAPPAQSSRD